MIHLRKLFLGLLIKWPLKLALQTLSQVVPKMKEETVFSAMDPLMLSHLFEQRGSAKPHSSTTLILVHLFKILTQIHLILVVPFPCMPLGSPERTSQVKFFSRLPATRNKTQRLQYIYSTAPYSHQIYKQSQILVRYKYVCSYDSYVIHTDT